MPDLIRQLLFTFRVFLIFCGLALFVTSLLTPISWNGRLLYLGIMLLVVTVSYPKRLPKRALFAALSAIPIVSSFTSSALLTKWNRAPFANSSQLSLIGTMVHEEDGVLPAFSFLRLFLGLSARESAGLSDVVQVQYEEMRRQVGIVPTPLLRSALLLQNVGEPDLLTFDTTAPTNKGTVIFLHGTGGNWSLPCWSVSKAVSVRGFRTVCPSIGLLGFWGSASGMSRVRETISRLRAKGESRFVLVGWSAGGVGAGEIAGELGSALLGNAMLFGGHPLAARSEQPILFVFGDSDERFPIGIMRFIGRHFSERSIHSTIHELAGADHLTFIKEPERVLALLADWLATLEPASKTPPL
jgi:pimeloyl-ACP methyl ester carboxylesterase